MCVGYSNIFIHCGINNLKHGSVNSHGAVTNCFEQLKFKIQCIRTLCRTSRVFMTPIMPTKDLNLNNKAVDFNKLLFDYIRLCDSSLKTLNFNSFCSGEKVLIESLGRFQAPHDKLHLGSAGIRKLASIFRETIYKRMVDQRSYSSVFGHNNTVTPGHITYSRSIW